MPLLTILHWKMYSSSTGQMSTCIGAISKHGKPIHAQSRNATLSLDCKRCRRFQRAPKRATQVSHSAHHVFPKQFQVYSLNGHNVAV